MRNFDNLVWSFDFFIFCVICLHLLLISFFYLQRDISNFDFVSCCSFQTLHSALDKQETLKKLQAPVYPPRRKSPQWSSSPTRAPTGPSMSPRRGPRKPASSKRGVHGEHLFCLD